MAASTQTTFWHQILEQGVHAMVKDISDAEVKQLMNQYATHNYKPLPVIPRKAEGARVWDENGKEYLDCIGSYSATAHGHLNPHIVKAALDQLEHVAVTSRAVYNAEVGLFCKALTEYSDMDVACLMNTGTEAVETCIKLARKWSYTVKGIPENQAEILVFRDNFHGRSTTIVGFSTEDGYQDGFGPFTPGFKVLPFGELEAVKAAITPNTAAILAEPIQAEGGILIPPDGYMAQLRELCDANNVLLIWDEVQTGFCRTGKKFAWQYEDAKPDLMAVGKPLGGGLVPVSAALGRQEVMDVFTPGTHGSTFGGNPFGSAIALAALAVMEVDGLADRSAHLGAMLLHALQEANLPHLIDIRGRGLLIGFEVGEGSDTIRLSQLLLEEGILTKETRNRTFRLTPPLTITEADVTEILQRVSRALQRL